MRAVQNDIEIQGRFDGPHEDGGAQGSKEVAISTRGLAPGTTNQNLCDIQGLPVGGVQGSKVVANASEGATQDAVAENGSGRLGSREATEPTGVSTQGATTAAVLFFADILDDLEAVRIANENRLRSLSSQDDWGKGIPGMLPEVQLLTTLVDQLRAMEHGAELALQRAMRKHPLGGWCKATIGVGEKQLARLLAAIGDPYTRPNVAKLWAFCGLHVVPADQALPDAHGSGVGVAPRRRRNEKANWNPTAKMRVYLVAESCMKNRRSPYRTVYEAGRAKYENAVHAVPCTRCGPKGSPAAPGSPLSAGHQHARAMRLVMKALLRDLWVEARAMDASTFQTSPALSSTHSSNGSS